MYSSAYHFSGKHADHTSGSDKSKKPINLGLLYPIIIIHHSD
jgi:hypothetical protein